MYQGTEKLCSYRVKVINLTKIWPHLLRLDLTKNLVNVSGPLLISAKL